MKIIAGFIISVLFSSNIFAARLCDDACELFITFPEGGRIEAIEALTITFGPEGSLELGATGTVNTNPQPVNTDFATGGELSLQKGDSIDFDANGLMSLGVAGNIEYDDILLNISGFFQLTAVAGTETINIEKLSMIVNMGVYFEAKSILMNSALTLDGSLVVSDGEISTDCSLLEPNELTISSSTLSSGDMITAESCEQNELILANNLDLSSETVTLDVTDNSTIVFIEVVPVVTSPSTSVTSSEPVNVEIAPTETEIDSGSEATVDPKLTAPVIISEPTVVAVIVPATIEPDSGSESSLQDAEVNLIDDNSAELVIVEIEQTEPLSLSFVDEAIFSTVDGNTCTQTDSGCISQTGQKYVEVDGQLVPETSGGGVMNLLSLFQLLLLMLWLKPGGQLALRVVRS